MKTFTGLHRQEQIEGVTQQQFDVVIIGGGITGAGIALDAVTRGMKVALVEMQDFAEGTSSRSTKLVHGGLRYLKQFHIKEVAELGRERAIVYENGPHVTTPVWMLLPFYKGGTFGSFTTAIGLKVYDVLAGVKKGERRFMLNKEKTLQKEPLLNEKDLVGGGVYVEYRTDDARLTIEVLKAANEYGATLLNYTKAIGISQHEDHYHVKVYDEYMQETYEIQGKKIVNAAGPWIDEVRALNDDQGGKHLILSKGVHLVFDEGDFPLQQAIYFDVPDGRMIFAIPREGKTYVGTTDTFYDGDAKNIQVEKEDVDYLINAIQTMFPHVEINQANIESSWAGVRPLIQEEGKGASEISRKDEIWIAQNGVITIAGGKLTGYRKMAQDVVDVMVKQFVKERRIDFGKSITKKLPISGGDLSGSKYYQQFIEQKVAIGIQMGLSEEESKQLATFYGTNVEIVYKFIQGVTGELPAVLYGRLHYAIYYESVLKPVDFFVRRTGKLFFDLPYVKKYQEAVCAEMAKIFQWDIELEQQYRVQLEQAILASSLLEKG
jgi:glycerol-3-phosphate dehydrogenase